MTNNAQRDNEIAWETAEQASWRQAEKNLEQVVDQQEPTLLQMIDESARWLGEWCGSEYEFRTESRLLEDALMFRLALLRETCHQRFEAYRRDFYSAAKASKSEESKGDEG